MVLASEQCAQTAIKFVLQAAKAFSASRKLIFVFIFAPGNLASPSAKQDNSIGTAAPSIIRRLQLP